MSSPSPPHNSPCLQTQVLPHTSQSDPIPISRLGKDLREKGNHRLSLWAQRLRPSNSAPVSALTPSCSPLRPQALWTGVFCKATSEPLFKLFPPLKTLSCLFAQAVPADPSGPNFQVTRHHTVGGLGIPCWMGTPSFCLHWAIKLVASSLSLLQGIFPTQGSNQDLWHCRRILY